MIFFFQAEDGIRDLVRSRGLGDVYKRQDKWCVYLECAGHKKVGFGRNQHAVFRKGKRQGFICLLYTSDAADERSSVDLGGRRVLKKKNK